MISSPQDKFAGKAIIAYKEYRLETVCS